MEDLVPLSRGELYSRLGLLREVDPLVTRAYRFAEIIEALEEDRGHGRTDPWHVSFHGSNFPGNDPKACGRQALYRMLNAPRGAFNRRGRQFMDAGKDFEVQLVKRLHRAGFCVSAPPWDHQTQFEDEKHWLTCTTDIIVCWPRSPRPFVVEVKQIFAKDVEGMKMLLRGPTSGHVKQVKCEIGLAHERGTWKMQRCHNAGIFAIDSYLDFFGKPVETASFCPMHGGQQCLEEVELEPVQHGYLYYVSRDDMVQTREFYFEHDPGFMEEGRRQLADWRDHFERGVLPQTNFVNKRFAHPFGWKWGDLPCKWCDYGEECRNDMVTSKETQKPVMLADSDAVERAIDINPDYNYDEIRQRVFARWGGDGDGK